MPMFKVNANRTDPYKNYKFVVKFNNKVVAGLSKCTALKFSTGEETWKEAGLNTMVRRLPTRTEFQPITLEAGVTHDMNFYLWATATHMYTGTQGLIGTALKALFGGDATDLIGHYKRDVRVELLNEQGTPAIAYNLYSAWVKDFTGLPDLDANGKAVAITSITVVYNKFEFDKDLKEPKET